MTSHLRRRIPAVVVTAALMTAGLPGLAHASDHPHPRPPRASTPRERVAYLQRPSVTSSDVPQRTAAV